MSKKEKKKKKARRSEVKYPALDPRYMPKVRQEYADIDYVDKLSDEPTIEMPDGSIISEKAWMNKFMDEELNASFKNDSRDITQDSENKKRIYGNNNARNRCMYGIAKASNLVFDDSRPENDNKIDNPDLFEDAMIASIDEKKED